MAKKKKGVHGSRRQSRECALQYLFQREYHEDGFEREEGALKTAFDDFCRHFDKPVGSTGYAWELVAGLFANREEVDAAIRDHAKNWRLERMTHIDRNILRIAAFEILFQDDVPSRVAMNEAVEIAKQYGDPDSPSFINGVLDSIQRLPAVGGNREK